ncbi:MAG: 3-hydroxyisobutyrate dehydrogenase [Alphaproteobacteria bacterium]|nr:3-hydroxyisobutyrate dehydrogenase [Alphaproteobacteria bacterium]
MTTIGFIGLGNMGGPMAANLLTAGHDVKGFDLAADTVETFTGLGGTGAGSIADAASEVDVVVTMLPAGKHVRSVYCGADGVLQAATAGTLLIDCSTIDVAAARETNADAEKAGFAMLDAPVSGGVGGASAGTLTFMVGGSDEAFEMARPLFEIMGKTVVHCGGAGNGQAAKICNNMVLGVSMIAVCEAFALADRLGLDRQKLFDVSSTSSGQCWSLTTYCPVPGPVPTSPANRDYEAGFTADMMLKDLRLAQDAAQSEGAATPLGRHARDLYEEFSGSGERGTDFSGIFKMLQGDPGD